MPGPGRVWQHLFGTSTDKKYTLSNLANLYQQLARCRASIPANEAEARVGTP